MPVAAACLVAACSGDTDVMPASGDDADAPVTAATLGEQTLLSTEDYLALPAYADADPENGQRRAQMCRTCHTLGAGGVHMIGPNLFALFGRSAGSAAGYDYSEVLRDADFIWTPKALDAWLARPAQFLPGNRMGFPGVAEAGDRADVIAYLLEATSPQDGD